jgi:hypothetical protein
MILNLIGLLNGVAVKTFLQQIALIQYPGFTVLYKKENSAWLG